MAETAEKTYKGLVIQLPEKWKTAEEKEERIEEAVLFKLAETYPIDVPESLVENEVQAMVCQLYQEMRYKALRTGEINFFVERDIQDQMEDIQKEARRQVKIRCILQEITETEQIQISREELELEAEAMAERQHTTVREIKSFFGENLDMLREDLLIRKTIQRICKSTVIL